MPEYNYSQQNLPRNFSRSCLIALAIFLIVITAAIVIFGALILKRFPIISSPSEGETITEKTFAENEFTTTEEIVKEQQVIKIETKEANPVTAVAKKVQPSVVNIVVDIVQYDIFGQEFRGIGIGSGVIFSKDGYILTNNHVVENAEGIEVTFYDGKKIKAELVGTEPRADIAVIKVDRKDLKPAEFVSVRDIEVGDLAVAIGSPLGLQQTVTSGVVSALGREIFEVGIDVGKEFIVDLIQTDAAINEGNSGGALANIEGRVMGINTIMISPTRTYIGLGFAIPSDIATNIANQLIKYGKSRIPIIGINMADLPDASGVFIHEVFPGLPAERAGIQAGDIIIKCNGIVLENSGDFLSEIIKHNVGDKLELEINRNGRIFKTTVELVDAPPGYGQ